MCVLSESCYLIYYLVFTGVITYFHKADGSTMIFFKFGIRMFLIKGYNLELYLMNFFCRRHYLFAVWSATNRICTEVH